MYRLLGVILLELFFRYYGKEENDDIKSNKK